MKKIFIIFMFSLISPYAYAHGGDEHLDSKPVDISSVTGKQNKVIFWDDKEILLKYDSFQANKITIIDLFITDKNNQGIKINNPVIYFENENSKVKSEFENTNTDGWYHGHSDFHQEGDYKASLLIEKEKIDLGNFHIEEDHIHSDEENNPSLKTSILLIWLFLIFFSAYWFFSPKSGVKSEN